MDTRKILFARYRLNLEALRQHHIYVLDFPYWEVIDEFLSVIAQNPTRQQEDYLFTFDEDLPFRRLNPVLVGAFPHAIQGFETYGGSKDKIYLSGLRRKVKPRRMIALALHEEDEVEQNPVIGTMDFIIQEWLEEWAKTNFENGRFGNELQLLGGAGQKALKVMLGKIQKITPQWKQVNVADLWEKQNTRDEKPLNKLAYNALPSFLAAQFVKAADGLELELVGKDENNTIREWWLTQNGSSNNKHLAVVSEPMLWQPGTKEGKFSYMLQFVVQTQAGSNEPWIAVYISIRRWMTKPLKSTNFKRDVSIYLKLASSWTQSGQFSNTLIQLKLHGYYNKGKKKTTKHLEWKDNPSSLLQNLKGGKGRGLVNPTDVVENPTGYHNAAKDQYYGLHAEGMDYVGKGNGHPVNTGTALALRGQLMPIISAALSAYLMPDTALDVDPKATLQLKTVRGKRWSSIRGDELTSLFTNDDLAAVSLLPRGSDEDEKTQKKMTLTVQALMRASQNRKVRILTFYRGEGGRTALPHYMAKTLFLDDSTELPVQIELVPPIVISDALAKVPASDYKEKPNPYAMKQYVKSEFRQKKDDWVEFLQEFVDEDAYNLAFIEMDDAKFQFEECTTWLKQAMRHACVEVGINSQMIYFLPPDVLDLKKSLFYGGHLSRVKNANYDLLLRQTALRYGEPSQIYELAGLSPEEAKELIVVGLYRHVTNFPTSIDYPTAVISHPDGRTEVILPDEEGIYVSQSPIYKQVLRSDAPSLLLSKKELITSPMRKMGQMAIGLNDLQSNYSLKPMGGESHA